MLTIRGRWTYKPNDACLIAILKYPVVLAFLEHEPGSQFYLGDDVYENLGFGDFNGFYDWLRLSRDIVIGVDFYPIGDDVLSVFKERVMPSSQISPNTYPVRMLFGEAREFDPQWTILQDFGSNLIFKNSSNQIAITFGLHGLTELAKQGLSQLKRGI